MSRVLFADHDYHDIALEREILDRPGIALDVAQCRTEDDVIAAAKDARGILLQYAPVTERVVAAIVAHPGRAAELTTEALRAWAKERIAPYKIPRDVVLLPALPRNALGKVVKPDVIAALRDRA